MPGSTGFSPGLLGFSPGLPGSTGFSPGLPGSTGLFGFCVEALSFQIAFTSMSEFTLILSPTAFFSVPTIQPSNVLPSGALNPFSGNSYSLPFLTSFSSILPVPVFPLKLTLYSMSFHTAFTSVSAFTVILSPTAFFSVPTIQPSNVLPSGALNPLADNLYFEPFVISAPFILPVPPFPS